MAFVRPTLSELVERVEQDFISRLELSTPLLRRALARVTARVVAGAVHMLHGHLEYLARQIFPDRAERAFLVRWGALFGVTIKPAAGASGYVTITGTGFAASSGSVLLHADGTAFNVDDDADLSGGSAQVMVYAKDPGATGNRAAGTELVFQSPLPGVNATAVVSAGGLVNGSDEEDLEDFRARVLERMRSPPHGGSEADYVAWAKEVPGVTRAWCYPLEDGPGTVTVRFVRDDDEDLIPDGDEVTAVQDYIVGGVDHPGLAPVTAAVQVLAPVAVPLNFTVHLVPDNADTRAAVTAELNDLLRRIAEPGAGGGRGTIPRSQVLVAVGTADGVTDFSVAAPAADVVRATGEIATMGTVTFT